MNKYKYHIVFITIIIIVFFFSFSGQIKEVIIPAKEGLIDLSELNLDDEVTRLDGQWEIYWNQLLSPVDVKEAHSIDYIEIPGSWNSHSANKEKSAYGYASFRLEFIANENSKLGLKVPRMFTAYKLWVNGQLLTSAGEVGKSLETSAPKYLPQVVLFESKQGVNEILIHVSNYHYPSGGMSESIYLGHEKQIVKLRELTLARELVLFTSLTCVGLYHLAIYGFRKEDTSSLYFGLLCTFIGARTLLVGERFFVYLFPRFNWELDYKLQTLAFYFTVALIITFFRSLYPNYFKVRMVKISHIITLIFGGLVVLTPARIFLQFNFIYQVWAVIAVIYGAIILIKVGVNKEGGSRFIILGALSLLIGSVNDILYHSVLIKEEGNIVLKALITRGNLSSVGQLVFAFVLSLILSKRFTDALEHEEFLTSKLTKINTNLDQLVIQRTKDLEESNKRLSMLSFKDPLSGLWNRRKYDETIAAEWNRCLRYQKPLSLLILDIDYFKELNDFYGHMVGDECIIKVGQVLKGSLRRSSDMVARYGGEEFIVILPETVKEEAICIGETLKEEIASLKIPHEKSPISDWLTVSVGASSVIPDKSSSYEDLFVLADKALYQAKDGGRNQLVYLSE